MQNPEECLMSDSEKPQASGGRTCQGPTELTVWKAAGQKMWIMGKNKLNMSQQGAFVLRKAKSILAAAGRASPASQERSLSSTQDARREHLKKMKPGSSH
ncbi:hypothetical protein TURU_083562 [Turdus rufiventris]|nr:hypothetical protein TURU_083562 [Turdus rufiventris]